MQINGDNEQSKFVEKLVFIQATLDVANELALRTRSYLLEMTFDQKGESYAVRKAARLAALKKCKATVEKEFSNRDRGEMTEEVPDERTFHEMLVQLEELMLKLQHRFAVKTFERIFFVVLLDSIEAIIDELRIRDQLEMELPRSKSSMGLFYFLKSGQNDNSESEDDTDYYVDDTDYYV